MSPTADGSPIVDHRTWGLANYAADSTSLACQFVSEPMAAGIAFVTTDTIKCYIRVRESGTNANINRQPICFKVVSQDGLTIRATVKALGHYGPNTVEWNFTFRNKTFADGDTLDANYTTVAGDRLVLEVGGQIDATVGGTNVGGYFSIGSSAGSDLGENETDTVANNPWFEISRSITFLPYSPPAPASGATEFTDRAAYIAVRKVLRVVQNATAYDEWRIVDRTIDRNLGTITLTCASMVSSDVSEGALVSRTDADGVVLYDFESVGLTPTEHINTWVLPALAAAGFGWITLGTITPTDELDLIFSWDTPLEVLLRIAAATKMELDISRNGTTGYKINIVAKVNAAAAQADLRFDKNTVNVIRDEDTIEMATRVFPKGAANSGENHATMARAMWEVGLISGDLVALVDPAGGEGPIQFDDQLNGAYLRKVNGTLVDVLDSFAIAPAHTVQLASVAGITVGDLIQFRANSTGTDLTSLTNPVTVDPNLYGEKVAILDLPTISGANNVIPNPFMRAFTGSLPAGWTAVGSPTLTHQTAPPYTALGDGSIKVSATADGQGVKSPAGAVYPTAANPYGSGYARAWVVSGRIRVELVITTPGGAVIFPASTQAVASNTVVGQWVDLGATGADLYALGATAVAVRVVQNGSTAAVFYVDAAQATAINYHEQLVEGSGGTRLWQAANEMLRTRSVPIITYTVPLVDLEALDPVLWSESALVVGGPVRVRDDVIGVDFVSRILEVRRDYEDPSKTAIIISNRYDDLLDLLAARPTTKRRKLLPPPPTPTPIPLL